MTPRSLLAPARLGGQPILRAQTDDRLVALARSGSRPAFEAIVSRYRRPLVAYCARFLGAERAEDAVQQTFVRAYTAFAGGEQVRSLRPWLYRIAHNTSLNTLRDRALLDEPLSDQIDGVERPDQAVERRQELQEVLSAVKALPARQRDAIVLRAIEGRSYEQIAQGLGVSDGAVRQLLNRARCSMRAGVAAVTPVGLLARIAAPLGDAPATVLAGSGGGGGTLAASKLCTAAVAAAIAGGGVSGLPDRPADGERLATLRSTQRVSPRQARPHPARPRPLSGGRARRRSTGRGASGGRTMPVPAATGGPAKGRWASVAPSVAETARATTACRGASAMCPTWIPPPPPTGAGSTAALAPAPPRAATRPPPGPRSRGSAARRMGRTRSRRTERRAPVFLRSQAPFCVLTPAVPCPHRRDMGSVL